MPKRVGSGPSAPETEATSSGRGVVDLADARVRLRSKQPSEASLVEELDQLLAFCRGSDDMANIGYSDCSFGVTQIRGE